MLYEVITSFVYHDKSGKHYLGNYSLLEVDDYENGIKTPKEKLSSYKKVESEEYGFLYYKKKGQKVKTIDISERNNFV